MPDDYERDLIARWMEAGEPTLADGTPILPGEQYPYDAARAYAARKLSTARKLVDRERTQKRRGRA